MNNNQQSDQQKVELFIKIWDDQGCEWDDNKHWTIGRQNQYNLLKAMFFDTDLDTYAQLQISSIAKKNMSEYQNDEKNFAQTFLNNFTDNDVINNEKLNQQIEVTNIQKTKISNNIAALVHCIGRENTYLNIIQSQVTEQQEKKKTQNKNGNKIQFNEKELQNSNQPNAQCINKIEDISDKTVTMQGQNIQQQALSNNIEYSQPLQIKSQPGHNSYILSPIFVQGGQNDVFKMAIQNAQVQNETIAGPFVIARHNKELFLGSKDKSQPLHRFISSPDKISDIDKNLLNSVSSDDHMILSYKPQPIDKYCIKDNNSKYGTFMQVEGAPLKVEEEEYYLIQNFGTPRKLQNGERLFKFSVKSIYFEVQNNTIELVFRFCTRADNQKIVFNPNENKKFQCVQEGEHGLNYFRHIEQNQEAYIQDENLFTIQRTEENKLQFVNSVQSKSRVMLLLIGQKEYAIENNSVTNIKIGDLTLQFCRTINNNNIL